VIASYSFTLDAAGNIAAEQSTTPLSVPVLTPKDETSAYLAANRLQTAGSTSFPAGNGYHQYKPSCNQ
jgi:hypothetical protein